jgi:hypothetical protein
VELRAWHQLLLPGIHYTKSSTREKGFRGVLYSRGMPVYDTLLSISNTLTIGLLLITFYSLPALILAYTSYIAYRQSKHQELLHPMTAALIPFIAVATLTLATPLSPLEADDYIPLPGRMLLHLRHLAPLTGTLLWTTIELAFLRLKKTLDLAGEDPELEPRPAHRPANPTH